MTRFLTVWALAASLLVGCASATWDDVVDDRSTQARPEPKEYPGVVESVRDVEMDSARTGVGSMAGAVIGGTAGSRVGSGRGAAVGGVVGTVAGAVLGEAAALGGTEPGHEITVRLGEGRLIVVTQPAGEIFRVGDRVRVISDGVRARVARPEEKK